MKMTRRTVAIKAISFGISLLTVGMASARAQAVTAVNKLDLTRFSGIWYEVARLPNKREKRCVGNVQMLFALGDKANHIQLVDSCETKAGYTDAKNSDGKTEDKLGDGKLKLGFWPFTRKYWVLATGPDYQWALVGSPNHKTLWIYSRTSGLVPQMIAEARAKASVEGFPIGKLEMTPQGIE